MIGSKVFYRREIQGSPWRWNLLRRWLTTIPAKSKKRTGLQHKTWPKPEELLTLQILQEVLADSGYSADKHKGWLKEVLTAVEQDKARIPTAEKDELVSAIKRIIGQHQHGKPMSDDVL